MIHHGKVLLQDTSEQVISKGFSITGSSEQVEDFTKELEVLNSQVLGGTKSVMIYGELSEQKEMLQIRLVSKLGRFLFMICSCI